MRDIRYARAEERNPLLASWRRSKEREAALERAAIFARRRRRCQTCALWAGVLTCVLAVGALTFAGRSPRAPNSAPQTAEESAGGGEVGPFSSAESGAAADLLASAYWPEATATAQVDNSLFFVAVNKYTAAGTAAPPGLLYPWLNVSAGEQIVEPFVTTTLVALPGGISAASAAAAAAAAPVPASTAAAAAGAAGGAASLLGGSLQGGSLPTGSLPGGSSSSGSVFAWDVGGNGGYLIGENVDVTFTSPNSWSDVTLYEISGVTGQVTRQTTRRLVTKYVRREIRRLDAEDLERVLDAMEVTYRVPTSEGQQRYGPDYRDAFHFVKQHNEMAGDTSCDAAHDGLGFLTSHMAMTLAYEKALQAVDPAVALPYWDYTIEAERVESTGSIDAFYDSELLTDDILGGFGREEDGYALVNGRWGRIPVDPKYWPDYGTSDVSNGYGLIRSPWNQNSSPYVTRCRHMFGADFDKVPTCAFHSDQLQTDEWATFGMQIQYKPHGSMHTVLAGGWGVDYKAAFLAWYGDENKANAVPLKAFGFQKDMWRFGLLQCPAAGSCGVTDGSREESEAAACTCQCEAFDSWAADGAAAIDSKLAAVNLLSSFKVDSDGNSISEDLLHMFCNLGGEMPVLGDAMSSAAPADPAFWPLHPTADRLWHWRRINGMSDETWPSGSYVHRAAAGATHCSGHDADDVVGYAGLFATAQLSMEGSSGGTATWAAEAAATAAVSGDDGGYTNAELYRFMNPELQYLPYVYDDFTWPHCAEQGYSIDLLTAPAGAAGATGTPAAGSAAIAGGSKGGGPVGSNGAGTGGSGDGDTVGSGEPEPLGAGTKDPPGVKPPLAAGQ